MTEANQRKLNEWFVKSGQKERAEAILKDYPQFADTPVEVEEITPKEEKKRRYKKK